MISRSFVVASAAWVLLLACACPAMAMAASPVATPSSAVPAAIMAAPQEVPAKQQPKTPDRADAAKWWNSLSPEEKEAARQRWKSYRELNPEAQAEMERRARLLRAQMQQVLSELSDEQRAELEALPSDQRLKRMHQLMRDHLQDRAKKDGRRPDLPPPPPGHEKRPLEDRLNWSKEQYEQARKKRTERELKRATQEGWVTEQAANALRDLPADQLAPHMERIRHLRMLNWLDEKGGWEKLGVPEEQRDELRKLAPEQFVTTMRERGYMKHRPRGRRDGGGPPRSRGDRREREGPRGGGRR